MTISTAPVHMFLGLEENVGGQNDTLAKAQMTSVIRPAKKSAIYVQHPMNCIQISHLQLRQWH